MVQPVLVLLIHFNPNSPNKTKKILAKELDHDNIHLSIRLCGILTTHEFDMGNIGQFYCLFTVAIMCLS